MDHVPPRSAMRSNSASNHNGSESTKVPSKSHSAAARVEVLVIARSFSQCRRGPGDPSGISTLDPASLCTSFRSTPRYVSARRKPGTAGAELGVERRDFTAVAWPPVRAAGVRDRLRIRSAGVEVLGLRMMDDQRVRRLFRMQLQLLRKRDADPLRAKQIDKLRPVFQIGTGGIAEGITGAL